MLKIAFTEQQLQKMVALGIENLQDIEKFYLYEKGKNETFSETLDRHYNEVFNYEEETKKEN